MSDDLHQLSAPYALDALDAHERGRFESHLEQCPACREELAGFHATGARLGEAETTAPPAGLRERLLAEVAVTSQERPVVTALSHHRRARRAAPRLLVAASVLIAIAGIGGYVSERSRANDLQVAADQVSAVVAASDAEMKHDDVRNGGTLRVIRSDAHDAAVVMGSGLQTLEKGKTYQVWAMHEGVPRSVGLMGRGSGMVYAADLADTDGFAVSIEPEGGSNAPTTDPVVALAA